MYFPYFYSRSVISDVRRLFSSSDTGVLMTSHAVRKFESLHIEVYV